MKRSSAAAFVLSLFCLNSAFAQGPAYCDLSQFRTAEIAPGVDRDRLERLHLYRLGQVAVAGLAVGDSEVSQMKNLAERHSEAGIQEGYCTFYLNDGNRGAEEDFIWEDLPNPRKLNVSEAGAIYLGLTREIFASNSRASFFSCIREKRYVALGCNGMKHRGPSVFGMLLAFSGCKPESAAKIVNSIWGLNGVKENVRLEIIRQGAVLAREFPGESQEVRELFSGK